MRWEEGRRNTEQKVKEKHRAGREGVKTWEQEGAERKHEAESEGKEERHGEGRDYWHRVDVLIQLHPDLTLSVLSLRPFLSRLPFSAAPSSLL